MLRASCLCLYCSGTTVAISAAVRWYGLLSIGGSHVKNSLHNKKAATPAGTNAMLMLPVQSTGNEESGSPLFVFAANAKVVVEVILVSVPKS